MSKARTLADFLSFTTALLRAKPPGTSADLTDDTIAYWNGHALVGVYLRDDDSGILDEEYDFEFAWDNWADALTDWTAAPVFSQRAELVDWIERRIA